MGILFMFRYGWLTGRMAGEGDIQCKVRDMCMCSTLIQCKVRYMFMCSTLFECGETARVGLAGTEHHKHTGVLLIRNRWGNLLDVLTQRVGKLFNVGICKMA